MKVVTPARDVVGQVKEVVEIADQHPGTVSTPRGPTGVRPGAAGPVTQARGLR